MDNISLFNNEAKQLMQNISLLEIQKKKIESESKEVKQQLLEMCKKYGIEKIDNEYIKITKVKGSETTSLDLTKLKNSNVSLYEKLLEDYPKTTKRNPYIRITVKGGK